MDDAIEAGQENYVEAVKKQNESINRLRTQFWVKFKDEIRKAHETQNTAAACRELRKLIEEFSGDWERIEGYEHSRILAFNQYTLLLELKHKEGSDKK